MKDLLKDQQWWVEKDSNLIPPQYRPNALTTTPSSPLKGNVRVSNWVMMETFEVIRVIFVRTKFKLSSSSTSSMKVFWSESSFIHLWLVLSVPSGRDFSFQLMDSHSDSERNESCLTLNHNWGYYWTLRKKNQQLSMKCLLNVKREKCQISVWNFLRKSWKRVTKSYERVAKIKQRRSAVEFCCTFNCSLFAL